MDKGHATTDKQLLTMEKKLTGIYSRANKEIGKKLKEYLKEQEQKGDALLDAIKAAKSPEERKKAEAAYTSFLTNKTLHSDHFKALSEQYAKELLNVNKTATDYINGRMPEVYSLNYNAVGGDISSKVKGYSFEMVDASTVKSLATKDETLLPYKTVDGKKDVRWNTKAVNSEITQGILQGESIPDIAKRLTHVTEMNLSSAIRNARTSTTCAENRGRMDSMHAAQENGIKLLKVWLSSNQPGRTRDEHLPDAFTSLEVELDEPFENGYGEIMYPGDPDADPANVYNCRCTLVTKVLGFENNKEAQTISENEQYFDKTYEKEREVYGKSDGMKYAVSSNGEVKTEYFVAKQDQNGKTQRKYGIDKTVEVSANPSDSEVLLQVLPGSGGFKDGEYRLDETKNVILTDGRIAVNRDTGNNNTRMRVRSMIENEIDILGGIREEGVFYRVTSNSKEANLIKKGLIKPSINHMTGEKELGLSVWETPKYLDKYLEKITGKVIATGSDGEPLLDVSTVKLLGVNEDNISKMREDGRRLFLKVYGWTETQLEKALKGDFIVNR